MLRTSLVLLMVACFIGIGCVDIAHNDTKLGIASILLGVVNWLFLTA